MLIEYCSTVDALYPTVTKREVAQRLGLSTDRVRQYQAVLNKIQPLGWEYIRGETSFTLRSFEVLKSYKNLIYRFGENEAKVKIHEVCHEKFKTEKINA